MEALSWSSSTVKKEAVRWRWRAKVTAATRRARERERASAKAEMEDDMVVGGTSEDEAGAFGRKKKCRWRHR